VGKGGRPIFYTYSNSTIVSKCFVQANNNQPSTKRKAKDDDDDDEQDVATDGGERKKKRRRRKMKIESRESAHDFCLSLGCTMNESLARESCLDLFL